MSTAPSDVSVAAATRQRLKVAIIGSGNIGTDLLVKVLRSPYLECTAFVGRNPGSPGMVKAQSLGVPVSADSIGHIERHPEHEAGHVHAGDKEQQPDGPEQQPQPGRDPLTDDAVAKRHDGIARPLVRARIRRAQPRRDRRPLPSHAMSFCPGRCCWSGFRASACGGGRI